MTRAERAALSALLAFAAVYPSLLPRELEEAVRALKEERGQNDDHGDAQAP